MASLTPHEAVDLLRLVCSRVADLLDESGEPWAARSTRTALASLDEAAASLPQTEEQRTPFLWELVPPAPGQPDVWVARRTGP